MSANLHIHVFTGVTEEDLAHALSCVIGSRWFDTVIDNERWYAATQKIAGTPQVWIGEVSWLKANLTDNKERYVPSAVGAVEDLIGDQLPVLLTAELREKILACLDMENTTGYAVATRADVAKFLAAHMGERLFTVSW